MSGEDDEVGGDGGVVGFVAAFVGIEGDAVVEGGGCAGGFEDPGWDEEAAGVVCGTGAADAEEDGEEV